MSALSPAAEAVRRHDPDRFLCALFAPSDRREALMLLYAFNHELARAREVASEPIMALIRQQWWREVVLGARRRHELAEPLADALHRGALCRADLLAMIDARAHEAEPELADLATFADYVRGAAGRLAVASGRALGADDATLQRLDALGAAYGAVGQARNVPALARQGRCLLPVDLLAAEGLTPEAVIARPQQSALLPVLGTIAAWARDRLAEGQGQYARAVISAALPAVLARLDLRRLDQPPRPRGLGDRLAVLAAAAASRV